MRHLALWCFKATYVVVLCTVFGLWLRWLLANRGAGFGRLTCVSLATLLTMLWVVDSARFGEGRRMPWLLPVALVLFAVNFLLRRTDE